MPGWGAGSRGPGLHDPAGAGWLREPGSCAVCPAEAQRGARPQAAVDWLDRRTGSAWPPRKAESRACVRTAGQARYRWPKASFWVGRPHPKCDSCLYASAPLRCTSRHLYVFFSSLLCYTPAVPPHSPPISRYGITIACPHQCPFSLLVRVWGSRLFFLRKPLISATPFLSRDRPALSLPRPGQESW